MPSLSVLMHDLHVRPDVTRWPKVEEDLESGGMGSIGLLKLRRHAVGCHLKPQAKIYGRKADR